MLKILSLGAGVQSSCLLLMSNDGILPKLDYAIFSDTQWEPESVYKHLEWIKRNVTIPVIEVSAGNIREIESVAIVRKIKEKGERYASLPFFTENGGMLKRQCSSEYKIEPVQKKMRELLGYEPRQRIPANSVELWFGITIDEQHRASISRTRWIKHHYPFLLDVPMRRSDCYAWMRKNGYPDPPRSSCICCPFHNNNEWLRIKESSEKEWNEAVEFDKNIRNANSDPRYAEELYLHKSLRPLSEVGKELQKSDQSLWDKGSACDGGYCGL